MDRKIFCITGSIRLKHSEVSQIIYQNNGVLQKKITPNCSFLIVGDPNDKSKTLEFAKSHNIMCISEAMFLNMFDK